MADLANALDFSVTRRPDGVLISLAGQFTFPPASDKLRGELEQIYAINPALVVLDFTNVTFIASLGIGVLAEANHRMRALGGKLRVCGLKPAVMDVFKRTRMTRILDISDTPEAAFALIDMYSIVICSINDARFAAVAANLAERFTHQPHEIIRISDAKSLAEGYNRGIAQSRGDRLIFCHDDIEVLSPDFAARLDEHLNQFDVVGVAGANRMIRSEWISAGPPHVFGHLAQLYPKGGYYVAIFGVPARSVPGICVMDGLFLAARRAVIEKIKFDSQTFDGFHHYDLDFTFAAHLAGFRLAVATDLFLLHASSGNKDERWKHYARLFHQKYAQHLHPMAQRTFAIAAVQVPTKEEALEVMTQTLACVRT